MQYILTLQDYDGLGFDAMHFGRYEPSTYSRAAFLMPVYQIRGVMSEQTLILIFTAVEVSNFTLHNCLYNIGANKKDNSNICPEHGGSRFLRDNFMYGITRRHIP